MKENELQILIQAAIDQQVTIPILNKQIARLQHKVNALKLNVEINDKVLATLKSFSEQMKRISEVAKNTGKVIEQALLPDGTKVTRTHFEGLGKTFQQTVNEAKKYSDEAKNAANYTNNLNAELGQQKDRFESVSNEIGSVIKKTKELNSENKVLKETLTTLNKDGVSKTVTTDADGNKKISYVDNTGQKALQTSLKAQQEMEQAFTKMFQNREKEARQWEHAQQKAIQKNLDLERKSSQEVSTLRKDFINDLSLLERKGTITTEQFEKFKQAADMTRVKDDFKDLNHSLDELKIDNTFLGQQDKLRNKLELIKREGRLSASELQRLNTAINSSRNVKELEKVKRELTQVQGVLKNVGMMEQLKVAMSRIPIWMVGMSAFYAPLRAMQDAVSQIIQIDSQMTTLKRVSGGMIDNSILSESVVLAEKLGNTIIQINEGLTEFARQGFRGEGLMAMTEAATLFSNISELTVAEAGSGLTAIINGFKMLPEEIMVAVDAINEIDNNFAVSSQNIVQSIQKSVGAAETFGVTLQELAGYSTAVGEVTRESGNIIGNSLKTIFSRITTMQPSIDALKSVGISIHDMEGNVRPVARILDELALKWSSLNAAQQQQIGLTLAGRFQLSRFLILMQNYQTAIDATATAMNSQGSATRENEQYLLSLEARLNKVKNAWTEMALTMGDALLSDGIVEFSEMVSNLTKSMSNLMKHVGFLPPVIGTVSFAFMVLNNGIRTTIANAGLATTSATTLQTRLLSLGASAKLVGTAFLTAGRFMVGAFPPLLLITGITYGLEKLLSAWMKGREEARQYEETLNKQVDAYSKNSVKIKEQAEEYIRLKSKVELTSTEKEKLINIANELSDVLPQLSENIDNNTLSYEEEAKVIRANIELYEELRQAKVKLSIEEFDNDIEEIQNNIEDLTSQISQIDVEIRTTGFFGNLENEVRLLEKKQQLEKKLDNEKIKRNERLIKQAKNLAELYATSQNLTSSDMSLIDNIGNQIASKVVLDNDLDFDKQTNEIYSYIESLSSLRKILGSSFNFTAIVDSGIDLKDITEEQISIFKRLQIQINDGTVNFDKYISALADTGVAFDVAKEIIGKFNQEYQRTQDLLNMGLFTDPEGMFPIKSHEEYNQLVEDGVTLYVKINGQIQEYNDNISTLIDTHSQLQDTEKEVSLLVKANKELIDINMLSIDTITELSKKYGTEFIRELAKGESAVRSFLETKKNEAITSIKYDKERTLSELENSRIRVEAITKELEAIKERERAFASAMPTRDNYFYDRRKEEINSIIESEGTLLEIEQEIAELTKRTNAQKYLENLWKSSSSKDKKTTDPYIIDTYQQAISNLDTALKILESDMSKYVNTSQEYQENLSSQIYYLSKKEDLIKNEIENTRELISILKQQESTSKNLKVEDRNQLLKDIESAESKLNSLVTNKWDITLSLDAKNYEQGLYKFNQLNATIEEYDNNLSMIQAAKGRYEEGSAGWNQLLLEENKIYSDKKQILLQQMNALEALLSTLTKGTTIYKETNDLLNQTKIAYLQVGNSIQSVNESIKQQREKLADDMIAILKKAIEKEKELRVKAIDKELNELEKAHKKRIDFLEEELDKYQEIINARLQSIERAEEERDFEKEINKATQEKQEIQNKINVLMLDDSLEAHAQRKDLEEQLNSKIEEINEMQHKRTIDLRKQNLQDMSSAYKKEIDGKKKSEIAKYNATKERLEKEKRDLKYHYDEWLANEEWFNNKRQEIIRNGISDVNNELIRFADAFKLYLKTTNDEISMSIGISRQEIKNLISDIEKVGSTKIQYEKSKGIGTGQVAIDNEHRLNTDKNYVLSEIERSKSVIAGMRLEGKDTSAQEYYLSRLFQKIASFDTGGYTGNFKGGKLAFLHENERVLNQNETINWINGLNTIDQIVSKIKNFNQIQVQSVNQKGSNKSSQNIYNVDVKVNVNGDKDGGKQVYKEFIKELRLSGGVK